MCTGLSATIGKVDPDAATDMYLRATSAVTEAILSRSLRLNCVGGSRILVDLLSELGSEVEAFGTVLLVHDPIATATRGDRGATVQIGGHGREDPSGFNGHIVVRSNTADGQFLLDPTIGQLRDIPLAREFANRRLALAVRLKQAWPTPERQRLALPVDGWSLAYEHQPDMEWDTHSSWTDPTNRELLSEAREVYERGPNLERYLRRPQRPRLVGRNEPCVCGSGRKYKHCHGRPEL